MQDVLNRDGRRLLIPLFGSVAHRLPHRLRERRGIAADARPATSLGVRDALRARRRTVPTLPSGASPRVSFWRSPVLSSAPASPWGSCALLKAIAGQAVPRADMVHIGWPVLAFGFLAAVVAARHRWSAPRGPRSLTGRFQGLKGTRTTARRSERRLLSAVATLQIVLTVALLGGGSASRPHGAEPRSHGAGLRHREHPGHDGDDDGAAEVDRVPSAGARAGGGGTRSDARCLRVGRSFDRQQMERRRRVPGANGHDEADRSHQRAAALDLAGLLRRHGHAIAEGRAFRATDGPDAPRVVIVNATLAKRYYADRNPSARTCRLPAAPTSRSRSSASSPTPAPRN